VEQRQTRVVRRIVSQVRFFAVGCPALATAGVGLLSSPAAMPNMIEKDSNFPQELFKAPSALLVFSETWRAGGRRCWTRSRGCIARGSCTAT
jgi:hypothetical protein